MIYDTEYFIKRARKIHGNKYDYSKSIYKKADNETIIICKKHGEFKQIARVHLKRGGCPKCRIDSLRSNKEEFIKKAKKIHGDRFDYSLVNYIGCRKEVIIICKKHGKF